MRDTTAATPGVQAQLRKIVLGCVSPELQSSHRACWPPAFLNTTVLMINVAIATWNAPSRARGHARADGVIGAVCHRLTVGLATGRLKAPPRSSTRLPIPRGYSGAPITLLRLGRAASNQCDRPRSDRDRCRVQSEYGLCR